MYMYIFKNSPKSFVFVYFGAKLQHFEQTDIMKCNTHFMKCNL